MGLDAKHQARERARKELDHFFREKIAARDGISPDDVTTDYIRTEREKKFYPRLRYDIGSNYGGYSGVGLHFSTGREIEDREQRMLEALEEASVTE